MSIISVKAIQGTSATDAPKNSQATRRWRVQTNSPADTELNVLSDLRLPRIGYPLASNSQFRCVNRSPQQVSPLVWEVDTEFSTDWDPNTEDQQPPLDRQAKVKITTRKKQVAVPKDAVTNNLITNTAGDPFVPPLKRSKSLTVYSISANLDYAADWLFDLRDNCNELEVVIRGRTWLPYTVLIEDVSLSDELWQRDQFYYKLELVLVCDPDTHKDTRLNDGLFELRGGVAVNKVRCQINGVPVDSPVPLAADGSQLSAVAIAADPINAPHYLSPKPYPESDFDAAGVPLPV